MVPIIFTFTIKYSTQVTTQRAIAINRQMARMNGKEVLVITGIRARSLLSIELDPSYGSLFGFEIL